MDPADDEMVTNFGLSDFCSSGNVAWKRRIGATAFIRECDSSPETLAEATGGHCVIMPAVCYDDVEVLDVVRGFERLDGVERRVGGRYIVLLDDQPGALRLVEMVEALRCLMAGISDESDDCRIGTTEQFGDETFADAWLPP